MRRIRAAPSSEPCFRRADSIWGRISIVSPAFGSQSRPGRTSAVNTQQTTDYPASPPGRFASGAGVVGGAGDLSVYRCASISQTSVRLRTSVTCPSIIGSALARRRLREHKKTDCRHRRQGLYAHRSSSLAEQCAELYTRPNAPVLSFALSTVCTVAPGILAP